MANNYYVFDMDGTIADLYGVDGWLDALRAYDVTPYEIAKPMNENLWEVAKVARQMGVKVAVVTWTAGGEQNKEYNKQVARAKREWLDKMGFPYDEFHAIKYGTTKANTIRHKVKDWAVLFDDNEKIRKGWHLGRAMAV